MLVCLNDFIYFSVYLLIYIYTYIYQHKERVDSSERKHATTNNLGLNKRIFFLNTCLESAKYNSRLFSYIIVTACDHSL